MRNEVLELISSNIPSQWFSAFSRPPHHSHDCRREQLWDSGPARKRAVSFEVQVLRVQISRYWLASLLCQFRTHLMNN